MIIKLNLWIALLIFSMLSAYSYVYADAEEFSPSTSVFRFQKQMAKRGNAESQFKLGLMYETGSGIKKSLVLATSWYKKAALQKHKPATNRLTYLDIKKSGFHYEHQPWLDKLKTDARFHEGEALFLLGQMYSEGTGVDKNLQTSLNLLRKASAGNIPGAEAEIIRVEKELAQIEAQKQNDIIVAIPVVIAIPPIAIKPKAIPVSSSKSKATKKAATTKKKTKPEKKIKAKKQVAKITKPKISSKPVTKPKAPLKTQQKKTQVKTVSTPVPVIKEAEETNTPHPMDTICGGSNRFRRGCR